MAYGLDMTDEMLGLARANQAKTGITNVRWIEGDWLDLDPPQGTVALVNSVTYLVRNIIPFVEKLERGALVLRRLAGCGKRQKTACKLQNRDRERAVPANPFSASCWRYFAPITSR